MGMLMAWLFAGGDPGIGCKEQHCEPVYLRSFSYVRRRERRRWLEDQPEATELLTKERAPYAEEVDGEPLECP